MATKSKAFRGRKQGMGRVRARKAPGLRPTYFLSLKLEKVRCFGTSQTLDLSDGQGRPARWTVVVGNNGTGKTTLLQSLAAFSMEASGNLRDFKPLGQEMTSGFTRWLTEKWMPLRSGSEVAKLQAELFVGHLESHRAASRRQFSMELHAGFEAGSDVPTPGHRALVCYGYGATRRMGGVALAPTWEPGPVDSLFFEEVPLRNAEEWLLQVDYAASKQRSESRRRLERVKKLLLGVLPGDVTDIRFRAPKVRGVARVEWRTPDGWVAMKDLGLGYRTLIAWMTDLASRLDERYPDSANPLAEPAVVLVDEVDLHMHPAWQRRVLDTLGRSFPRAQFVVTAHSPLVVQSAATANLAVLRRVGDQVEIDNDVDAIRTLRVDQILTSELFGLPSARPPYIEKYLEERSRLLSKTRRTGREEARLRELDVAIGPPGETQAERHALELLQRFIRAPVGAGA
jgi:hypothetical protein